jgi:hypothetical protein
MPFIKAVSMAPAARGWLADSRHPRILHIFDRVCNLIDEGGEVLSIVTQQIGNGPFSLLVDGDVLFSDYLVPTSPISIRTGQLIVGDLAVDTGEAKPWSPCPDWDGLHANKDNILGQLLSLSSPACHPLLRDLLISDLSMAIASADLPAALLAARGLAGLGNGLTPAGDDYILGAVYAARIIHPLDTADSVAVEVTDAAAPLTTSLSAAWLRAAGRGEAGNLWHRFFEALISADRPLVQESIENLLAVGHSSGADALAGYFGTLLAVPKTA